MKPPFQDILDLASYPPTWYDQNGTPRYCEFHPRLIHAHAVALFKIKCASCRKRFVVAVAITEPNWDTKDIEEIYYGYLNYGDPPRHDYHGNRCAGETMSCDYIRIMEFWRKDADGEWERVPEYEIYLVD